MFNNAIFQFYLKKKIKKSTGLFRVNVKWHVQFFLTHLLLLIINKLVVFLILIEILLAGL